ncbi:putative cysteine-rich repeat secretory protein 16 [Cardamine amara subsp. amara]|uniref:Cysteine-rich repeat secretory protein 16 n=1 Tax=Cardamine amara subsp. amara TaxID=228776 RepID=A0ABD0ZBP5_CARAN
MYSSSSVATRFVLISILAVVATQLLLMRTVSSLNMTNAYLNHKCLVSQGKYKPGSSYEENLTLIISIIASEDGFVHGYSNFENPEFVSVTFQCRGDSFGSKCRSCYATAVAGLRRRCPRYKGAIIWYDQCVLEIISTNNTEGKIDKDNKVCMSNPKKMNVDSFREKWMTFLDNLVGRTFKSRYMYAAGDTRFGTKKLYGMVQCRNVLEPVYKSCQQCLRNLAMQFQDCWNGKQGARVLGTSCNFRFELYPFVSNKSGPN